MAIADGPGSRPLDPDTWVALRREERMLHALLAWVARGCPDPLDDVLAVDERPVVIPLDVLRRASAAEREQSRRE